MDEGFEKIIYLTLEHYPDCKNCKDPTKKVTGRMIDAEGPGVVTPIYSCENKRCKIKKQVLNRQILHNAMEAEHEK